MRYAESNVKVFFKLLALDIKSLNLNRFDMPNDSNSTWEKPFDRTKRNKIEQIVLNIKREIKNGRWKPGDRLPSQREIAGKLDVSHGTVEKAFAILKEQKVIVTGERRETRVWQHDSGKTEVEGHVIDPGWRPVSPYRLHQLPKPYFTAYLSCSQPYPDIEQVPVNSFGNAYAAALHDKVNGKGENGKFDVIDECNHEAALLISKREINMDGASFLLVPATEALLLTAAAMAPRGGFVIMDTPDDRQALYVFSRLRLTMLFTGLDREGMRAAYVERFCRQYPGAVLFVRPATARPYNLMMTDGRRQELIAIAKKYGTRMIEMDPDHEMVFRPRLSPMAARDHGGLITYITSMSKVTAHMNETSIVVANGDFAGLIAEELQMADSWVDPFHALVQCRLINSGAIPDAAHRALNVYRSFLDVISGVFKESLAGKAMLVPPPAGLQVWITLGHGIEQKTLVPLLVDSGFKNPGGYRQHLPETKIYGLDLGMGSHDITQWESLFRGLSEWL